MNFWSKIVEMLDGGGEPEPSFKTARTGRVVDSAQSHRFNQPTPQTGRSVGSFQSANTGRNLIAYNANPGQSPMVRTDTVMGQPQYSPLASLGSSQRDAWKYLLDQSSPGWDDVGRGLRAQYGPQLPMQQWWDR